MTDFRHLLADDEVRAELFARRDELRPAVSGLESMRVVTGGADALAESLHRMNEGAYIPGEHDGLEAIVLRFTRPVFLVQDAGLRPPADAGTFALGESAVISARLSVARDRLAAAIPSVGRVDLRNHRHRWVGTGWMVAPEVAATNRHVAQEFAAGDGAGFPFRLAENKRRVKASLDWRQEFDCGEEAVAVVHEVLWIEPDGNPDVALLRVAAAEEAAPLPAPIPLMTRDEIEGSVGAWTAVVGYPARSPYNDPADQQRIFDGIYEVKRVAPGTITSVSSDGLFTHDATTLGGNSGSVVLDLAGGKAVGLHYGGIEGCYNGAVQASIVAELLARHS